jgi:hypothetical protein
LAFTFKQSGITAKQSPPTFKQCPQTLRKYAVAAAQSPQAGGKRPNMSRGSRQQSGNQLFTKRRRDAKKETKRTA